MIFKHLFTSLRPTHWLKNILILMPLLFGKKIFVLDSVLHSLWAFLAFCFLSSSIYIFNDLIDKESDSHHPLKKLRPIALGKIKPITGLVTVFIFFFMALLISFFRVNVDFIFFGLAYFFLGIVYTLWLRQIVILDIMVLSIFYVLRVLAGGAAINVQISHWMLISIGLLAIFISFHKRRHEIEFLNESKALHREVLSKYDTALIDQMIYVVSTATLIIYTFYTIDSETVAHIGSKALIFTVPFVYFGIFRYLYIARHKKYGGDPVKDFLTDVPSIINGCLWFIGCFLAIYFK